MTDIVIITQNGVMPTCLRQCTTAWLVFNNTTDRPIRSSIATSSRVADLHDEICDYKGY